MPTFPINRSPINRGQASEIKPWLRGTRIKVNRDDESHDGARNAITLVTRGRAAGETRIKIRTVLHVNYSALRSTNAHVQQTA